MKKEKQKILCICTMGLNRSKYLASYLKNKGYKTRFGGVGPCRVDPAPAKPINQKDIDWAEIIITVRKKHKPILKENYNVKGKKIISLDITDSRKVVGKKYPKFNNLDFKTFNKKWTQPQLRKAIKLYLPLN